MTSTSLLILGGENFVGRRVLAAMTVDGVTPRRASVAELEAGALIGCDTVINCTLGAPHSILATAQRLFELAAKLAQPPRIVHLGSMTIYGSASGLVDENTPLRDDLGAYGAAQIAAEHCARTYPRSVILRSGCEYGPDCPDWSVRVARWLLARRLGDLGENGFGRCNLLYIDDLVAAILASVTRSGIEGQAFNLASGSAPTWNEYLQRFAEALGALPLRRISSTRLMIETRLLAAPLKIAEIIVGKSGASTKWVPPPVPPSLIRLCRQDIRLDATKAESLLDLRWTHVDQGLQRVSAWLRDGGHS